MLQSMPSEAHMSELGLGPYLSVDGAGLRDLYHQDIELLNELGTANLATKRYESSAGLSFANQELAGLARETYTAAELAVLEETLGDRGTLDIPVVQGVVTVDGTQHDIIMVAATETAADGANHGDMSSMIYLRDQIQAAAALMKLSLHDPNSYSQELKMGKALLVSALHLMSTGPQLERFNNVILLGDEAGQADWPQISIKLNDLEGVGPNGWRNIQDTIQMLAFTTFEALEAGFLEPKDLLDAHKKSLGSMVPLLTAVGFPRYDTSGSWEENVAPRTSVMSIETALLHKIQTLTAQDTSGSLSFLEEGFDNALPSLGLQNKVAFQDHVETMLSAGLHELGRRLPYETPDPEYDTDWVKYRQADAALTYVLKYNLPQLLAARNIPIAANHGEPASATVIADMVLEQLETLDDAETGGIARYRDDAYQRLNFHTNVVQVGVNGIKRMLKATSEQFAVSPEALDHKQWLRSQIIPTGEEAVWTHPVGQRSGWAAELGLQALATGNKAEAEYCRTVSARLLNRALATVTGENQHHAVLDAEGVYKCRQAPSYRQPECYVAYELPDGRHIKVPSPHTPLNWSSATLKEALGLHRILVTRLEQD